MDPYRIDSHKLIYHPSRVSQWLKGEDIYPIYIEIGPSGACNHRCIFCALDYLEYQKRFIDKDILIKKVSEMASCGVRSIMYAGEGEPLLHKEIGGLILHTKKVGIDVALTTNGVFFSEKVAQQCLGSLTWVRFSLDAGMRSTYAKVHRCSKGDFAKVLANLSYAVKLKKEKKYDCTIGVQFLLIPENCQDTIKATTLLKKIGVDYLIIKPYSQHLLSHYTIDKNFHYNDYLYLEKELQNFSTDDFKIIFRTQAMKKIEDKEKVCKHCLGLPFWAYIDSSGDVWACSAYLGNSNFLYGNINKNSFSEIWKGTKRKQVLQMVETELDITHCRKACRLDEINRYLWNLKHSPEHVNFI